MAGTFEERVGGRERIEGEREKEGGTLRKGGLKDTFQKICFVIAKH